jgi:hypothetical protein
MNKYYAYSLPLLLMAIFSFVYADKEGQLAGYAFSFSFMCYVIANLLKGLKLAKIREGVAMSGVSDSGFRILIVKLSLAEAYRVSGFSFSKAREYRANFYNKENYTTRNERNSKLDIVCSKTEITVYEYSSDVRENPLIKHKYNTLNGFLKGCVSSYMGVSVRPGVQAMLRQIKETGRIDLMATVNAIEDARPKFEKVIQVNYAYIDSSKYLALLAKFAMKSS